MNQINKYLRIAIIIGLIPLTFTACDEKEKEGKLDKNGLTADINDLVPQSVLDEMDDLGMPIFEGDAPPSLAGTYLASPFELKASNRPSDVVGYEFSDYYVTFYNQDNDDLSIDVDYVNGPESGHGIGGVIVGEDYSFSVLQRSKPKHMEKL